MKIFIVGSGKLANALLNAHLSFNACEILKWESKFQILTEKAIIIHAGSGRQLPECIAYCIKTKSILIELSTGLDTENMSSEFPLIICPNTSILVLKTLNMIKTNGKYFRDYEISITESHQSSKTTEPGTAYAFANALKMSVNKIKSIRDPEIQKNTIGIPDEYLSKHAYHKISIKDKDDEITIETKVLGHNSYANGVQYILEKILISNLENKRYTILDLIENNTL